MTTTLERPPTSHTQEQATGVLDITSNGQGQLRAASCLPSPTDLQVSPALIRRYGLRKGDLVEGVGAAVRGKQRALTGVERVNGRTARRAALAARTSATSPRCTRASGCGSSTRRAA